MAGANKVEFPPLLPAGLHELDEGARKRLCVDRFPELITRRRILTNVEAVVDLINSQSIQGTVWIDGSFLTEKLNPDDADIAFVVPENVFATLSASQRHFFETFASNSMYDGYRIDNYGAVIGSSPSGQWSYAYWLRQFGFSRSDEMKGIMTISVPFLVRP